MLVDHRANATVRSSGDNRVSDAQGSRLDEDRRDGSASLVEFRFDRDTAGVPVRVRDEVETRVGREKHRVEQVVDAVAGESRDVDEDRVSTVFFGHESILGQLLANLGGVRAFLIDLVDRNHDGNVRGLSVVERLDRLGHDSVICRNHENRYVGDLSTTSTHGGERLVSRGVNEGDGTFVALVLGPHLVGTDGLGDSAGFARGNIGATNRIEKSGLTVVDVSHNSDNRRANNEVVLVFLCIKVDVKRVEDFLVFVLGAHDLDLVTKFGTENLEGSGVERLGRRRHLAELEQNRDEITGGNREARHRLDLVGEVVDRRPLTKANNGRAVSTRDLDATEARGLAHFKLLALGALGLARLGLTATTTERTRGVASATATAGATAWTTRATTGATRCCTGTSRTETALAAGGTTCAARALLERRVGATTGTGYWAARCIRTGTRSALSRHERVVAGRANRAGHRGSGHKGIVAAGARHRRSGGRFAVGRGCRCGDGWLPARLRRFVGRRNVGQINLRGRAGAGCGFLRRRRCDVLLGQAIGGKRLTKLAGDGRFDRR
ncbi:unannotated protein [freshwater metagenome]|uniref:Unannotated protein n=1 Tax=freshwater metagenome TaxID=449393 RepID=A0A6J7E196_9ZZZZ